MSTQMAERGIDPGEHAPVWAWHSVNRIGGKPDDLCARALMSDVQLEQGMVLLELEAPDSLALASCYGIWNKILYDFFDGEASGAQDAADCFARQLHLRRGRPPLYFQSIQACLLFIEPAWLVAWEVLDTQKIMSILKDIMEPQLIGYFAKRVQRPANLLVELPHIEQIASVSECISPGPPDWINSWKQNGMALFNNECTALELVPSGDVPQYTLFAYKMLPQVFREGE